MNTVPGEGAPTREGNLRAAKKLIEENAVRFEGGSIDDAEASYYWQIVGENASSWEGEPESGMLYLLKEKGQEPVAKRIVELINASGGNVQLWHRRIEGERDVAWNPRNIAK